MFDLMPFRRDNLTKREDFFSPFLKNFFNDDFFSLMDTMSGSFRVDLKETENSYVVEADLPGVQKEGIDIDFYNHYLTISAKRDDYVEDKKENYVRRERHYGELKRSFYIDNVDENGIDTAFHDGVLTITLPKLNKGIEVKRRIQIR